MRAPIVALAEVVAQAKLHLAFLICAAYGLIN